MIGDFALQSVAAHEQKVYRRAVCLKMDSTPLKDGDHPTLNPLVRYTNFRYTLKFEPSTAGKGKPYIIKADILTYGKLRVSCMQSLYLLRKEIPAVDWLLKWTNIASLFHLALLYYRTDLQIAVDIKKYSDYIKSIAPEQSGRNYCVLYQPEIARAREKQMQALYKNYDEYSKEKRERAIAKKLEENR